MSIPQVGACSRCVIEMLPGWLPVIGALPKHLESHAMWFKSLRGTEYSDYAMRWVSLHLLYGLFEFVILAKILVIVIIGTIYGLWVCNARKRFQFMKRWTRGEAR